MHSFGISAFFEILNFVGLIGLIILVFKKKLRAELIKQIKAKAAEFSLKQSKTQELYQHQENIITTLDQQDQLVESLKKKLATWQSSITQKNRNELEEQARLKSNLAAKIKQQSENYSLKKFQEHIAPDALKQSRILLKECYQANDQQEAYTEKIISYFEEHQ